MSTALRSLLTRAVDYAGLFPPARLPLGPAYDNFRAYLAGDDRWMLGKFICPIDRLTELTDLLLATPPVEPLEYCVLSRGGDGPEAMNEANGAGMVPVLRAERHMRFGGIEMPVSAEHIERVMSETKIAQSLPDTSVFFEIGWSGDWRARWAEAIGAVKRVESLAAVVGLKLRTGGVTADAFPPPGVVAGVMLACLRAGVRLKFTAGLHHPVRLFHDSVGTTMHGFINVFAAGVLARAHGLDEHAVAEILGSETPADFAFDDYGLRWKTLHAARQRVDEVRRDGLISFGSCSFDEPRDDLRALGWL